MRTILVPLDGSQLAEQALPYALALGRQTDAGILLLAAVTPSLTWSRRKDSVEHADDELRSARGYLRVVQRRLKGLGTRVRTFAATGKASDCIRAWQTKRAWTLLAMSTHSRPAPSRWFLGSTADALVRQSDAPCLVLRPEHPVEEPARGASSEIIGGGPPAVVVPAPVWTETPEEAAQPPARPLEKRRRRPERSPGR